MVSSLFTAYGSTNYPSYKGREQALTGNKREE